MKRDLATRRARFSRFVSNAVSAITATALAVTAAMSAGCTGGHLASAVPPAASSTVHAVQRTPHIIVVACDHPSCSSCDPAFQVCEYCDPSLFDCPVVLGTSGGGFQPPSGPPPPAPTAQTANTTSDLSTISTPQDACAAFSEGYDQLRQVCYSLTTLRAFGLSAFTYGACSGGSYGYDGSSYVLTCPVPPNPRPVPPGFVAPNVFYTYWFLADTGPPQQGHEGMATVGAKVQIKMTGPRVVFTNLSIAFFATSSDVPAKPFATGGGISVGLGI
jgi:hypothetical protein